MHRLKRFAPVVVVLTIIFSMMAFVAAATTIGNDESQIEQTETTTTTLETMTTLETTQTTTAKSYPITEKETETTTTETTTTSEETIMVVSTKVSTIKLATTTSTTTTTAATTTVSETASQTVISDTEVEEATTTTTTTTAAPVLTYLGNFRGTYYRGATNPCRGGSGRTLIDCAYGSALAGIKGSVACRYIYANYGYNVNGRTKVYIESDNYPSLNGWYYVDDCCASNSVIDFYYPNYSTCPFRNAGVISVKLYI